MRSTKEIAGNCMKNFVECITIHHLDEEEAQGVWRPVLPRTDLERIVRQAVGEAIAELVNEGKFVVRYVGVNMIPALMRKEN